MQSKATTVEQYLRELPPDRRDAIAAVRDVVRKNLDPAIEEGMNYGMIGYYIPHSVYPPGYHCNPKQPLPYACIASQKNYMAIYVMSAYHGSGDGETPATEHARWFRSAWAKAGKKLNMGKCCIRFTKVEDLALDVLGEAFRRVPAKKFIEAYEQALGGRKPSRTPSKAAAGKTTKKKSPARSGAKSTAKSAAKSGAKSRTSSKSRARA